MTGGRIAQTALIAGSPGAARPRKERITLQLRYTTIANYTDTTGAEHEIAVDIDAGGRFRVLDLGCTETLLVDVLRGFDDDADRAIACAEEYHRAIREYLAGERDDLPVAHPLGRQPVKLTDAGRAATTPGRGERAARAEAQQSTVSLAA